MNTHEKWIAQTTRRSVFILTALLILAVPLSIWRHIPYHGLILGLTLAASLPYLVHVERLVLAVCFYITAFEIPLFKGDLFPIPVNYFVLDAAFVLILFLFLGHYALKGYRENASTVFGWFFAGFFFMVGLSFLLGLYYNNSLPVILKELRILCYYGVYFVAVRHFRETGWLRSFFVIMIIAACFAAVDCIYTYHSYRIFRFVTRQVHVFLFTIPLLISLLMFDRNRLRKGIYLLCLLPVCAGVIVSQTRGSWVAISIAAVIAIALSVLKALRGRRLTAALALICVTGLVVLAAFRMIGQRSQAAQFTETRVQSMTNLNTDYSLMMRVNSYMTVLGKVREHPWLGNGLGDTATYLFFGQYSKQNNVDSTYLTLLWKMGFLGLAAFLALYAALLLQAFRVYRAASSRVNAVLAVTVLSAFSAYLILGTISPVLITYRFNFLFGTVFALIEGVLMKQRSLSSGGGRIAFRPL